MLSLGLTIVRQSTLERQSSDVADDGSAERNPTPYCSRDGGRRLAHAQRQMQKKPYPDDQITDLEWLHVQKQVETGAECFHHFVPMETPVHSPVSNGASLLGAVGLWLKRFDSLGGCAINREVCTLHSHLGARRDILSR